MAHFFSVNTVFFTILGYPMSYIEFFGTLFNLWCVWLVAKNNILTWPVGIVGIVLFAFLFYQIRLYSDLVEQVYFFVMSLYGWRVWLQPAEQNRTDEKKELKITRSTKQINLVYILVILGGTCAMGYFMGQIHLFLPKYFPEAASYPYLDAFTTVMSFAATVLMAHKKFECWVLWILVDIIGISLYFAKEVVFISLLYFIFLILATKGYFNWKKEYLSYAG